ncbi:MAG: trypsin-like peptidase domain-containing protein [Ignavibacteriales bacterium]|nr:trypsin-like peptidase domain-containing protein [Ignavibacteriales bacterium]
MKKNFLVLSFVLVIPLAIGIGIGYTIKPSSAASRETDAAFDAAFPTTVRVQDKSGSEQDQLGGSRRNAITRAIAKVSPATVGINVTEVHEQQVDPFLRQFFGNDPFFRQFVNPQPYKVQNLGSGVIISPDGYIVTNYHVAGNAKEITVTFVGGKKLKAKLVGADPVSDIALLKVEGTDLAFANLGTSDDIVIGEWAIALGNPFGLFEINDKPTVTVGVISSVGMNLGRQGNAVYRDMIETDAAINGGNSGGPLVNSNGDVVGINTLIFTGGVSQAFVGYGFAIPVNKVKKIVADLRKKGQVTRDIYTGFEAQEVDARVARYFGMTEVKGIIVSDVAKGGPAEKTDLRVGDIILETNGMKVNNADDFSSILSDASAGDMLKLKVFREKKMITLDLKLTKKP